MRLARLASGTPRSRESNLSLALQLLSFCNILLLTGLFAARAFVHEQPDRSLPIVAGLVVPQLVTAVALITVAIKLARLRRLKAQVPQG
jgi:hypothetical protein